MNRLLNCFEAEERSAPEYYIVRGSSFGYVMISRQTARVLIAQLRRWIRPRYIRLIDLVGSEVLLRPEAIDFVCEATPAQRALDRNLRRTLDAEENDWS